MNVSKGLVPFIVCSFFLFGCSSNRQTNELDNIQPKEKLMEISEIDRSWYDLRNTVYSKDYIKANSLLVSKPELIELTNSLGETVLHFLAVENDIDGVKWLENKGFNLNTKNDFGTPLLFEIAQLGYKDLLIWFCESGVDFSVKDKDGLALVEYLEEWEKEDMARFVAGMCT